MKSTRSRMAVVAVVVCGFAVGMAGLLDYFKYRRTAEQLMEQRLHYIGNSIEANIVASLAVGLQFSEIGTLPATLERARSLDDLIVGIDVLDTEGQVLYSTDRPRTGTHAAESWLKAAQSANGSDWVVHSGSDRAVGNALQNSFGLVIGEVALRYSGERVQAAALQVAGDLALNAVAVFAAASLLATLLLGWVMRKLDDDIGSVEAAIRAGDAQLASANVRRGPFGVALERFLGTVRQAEAQIVDLRGRLQRGVRP
jgi:hypothetical protein